MPSLKNIRDEACKVEWSGTANQPSLKAECWPGCGLVQTLGWVKKKNDGRWNWWMGHPKHPFFAAPNPPAESQGVAATEAEAKKMLEQFWGGEMNATEKLTDAQVRVLVWVDLTGKSPRRVHAETERVLYSHCEKVPTKRSFKWKVKDEYRHLLGENQFWNTLDRLRKVGAEISPWSIAQHGASVKLCGKNFSLYERPKNKPPRLLTEAMTFVSVEEAIECSWEQTTCQWCSHPLKVGDEGYGTKTGWCGKCEPPF